MIAGILERISYVRLLFKASTFRWAIAGFDSLVHDHLLPWSELQREFPSNVHPSVSIRCAANIHVAKHTRIQKDVVLWASPRSHIRIGEFTGLGPGTMIFSSNHQFKLGEPYYTQPWTEKDVTIGRDVWVGAGTLIMPGVTIGDCCVLAAGSVVTRDIPPNSLAAGVPARVLRVRESSADPVVAAPATGTTMAQASSDAVEGR